MRVHTAIAISVLSITAASAADLPVGPASGGHGHYYAGGQPAPMLVIYDDQPGVVVRAYWRAPWRNRHYFPTGGGKPEIGRDEDLSGGGRVPEPAETFERYWSTTSKHEIERLRTARPPNDETPPVQPYSK